MVFLFGTLLQIQKLIHTILYHYNCPYNYIHQDMPSQISAGIRSQRYYRKTECEVIAICNVSGEIIIFEHFSAYILLEIEKLKITSWRVDIRVGRKAEND